MGGIDFIGKIFIFFGVFLIIFGLIFIFIQNLKIPSLPLDFHIKKDGIHIFIPLGTSILVSIILTLLLNLILYLFFRK